MAHEKTDLADQKLASVGKLEDENAKLKNVVDEAKNKAMQLKEEQVALTQKRNELEAYLGGLAKKMFLMLEGTFPCPTHLQLLTHHTTADSSFFCVCRILSKLRGRDWAD